MGVIGKDLITPTFYVSQLNKYTRGIKITVPLAATAGMNQSKIEEHTYTENGKNNGGR